jgi:hypothetical protein
MKFKFLIAKIASVAALLLFSMSVSALPTSPTTGPTGNMQEIDGIYWAQPNLFKLLSWNDINTVCPSGLCAGTLKSHDMTGWNWASTGDMNGMLNTLTQGLTEIGGLAQSKTSVTLAEINMIFDVFSYVDSGPSPWYQIIGLTSSRYEDDATLGTYAQFQKWPTHATHNKIRTGRSISESSNHSGGGYGAWFYYGDVSPSGIAASAAVPEPSTLAIFALGLLGLASRRFKKQA